MSTYNTIIFDLGGVLIDWNPDYLYRKLIADADQRQWFLTEVCSMSWNVQQDAGRSWQEATTVLTNQYPDYADWIQAYANRWEEMLGGPIDETVDLLAALRQSSEYRLLALTNWSAETFPIARERYDFLQWFEGILVSGEEKMIKPNAEIYQLLLNRYQVDPTRAIFIDDSIKNIVGAQDCGIHGLHFQGAEQLKQQLENLHIQL